MTNSLTGLWATRARRIGGRRLGSSICGLGSRSWSVNIENQWVYEALGARVLGTIYEHLRTSILDCASTVSGHVFSFFSLEIGIFLVFFFFHSFWNLGFDVSQKACLLRTQTKIFDLGSWTSDLGSWIPSLTRLMDQRPGELK